MTSPVRLEPHEDVAVIIVDNPPVNALSHAVRAGIVACLEEAASDARVRAVVLLCAGRTFIAGADISEFGKPLEAPDLRDMLEVLDAFPRLTVAAIHGTALGGGLETALCCHYRLAVESARVGLPEVKLGLLPGAGGTQRLPRLTGVEKALDMMVSGDFITAKSALDLGIVDALTGSGDLQSEALVYTRKLLARDAPARRTRDLAVPAVAPGFFEQYRQDLPRRLGGFEAPGRIIECVQAAATQSFDAGMKIERRLFEACMASSQSVALRHLFFAERAAGRVPGLKRDTRAHKVATVGVVGAGTMGSGIALACMQSGIPVVLMDESPEGLERGVAGIRKLVNGQVQRGRIDADEAGRRLDRLKAANGFDAFGDVDMVIEAVFETMAVKENVFARLDRVCKRGAVLATNTSTLDVDRIAAATRRPQDVIGLHFFSPANVMRLLEIVRGGKTSDEVIASSLAFAKAIRKLGVVVGNCFGFVGNRMLYGYGRENQFLLLEGAAPEYIDQVLTDWGMAMGPNAVGDLAGLDVGDKVRQERTDLPDDPRYYRIATRLAEQGRYGQKTGKGIFRYEPGSREPLPDPEVHAMIRAEAQQLGVPQRDIEPDEIIQRCIYALILEGCRILEDGIAARPGDIDLIWVNGYGFPAYRGGPMCYADAVGIRHVCETVRGFEARFGSEYWAVPDLLREMAENDRKFADYPGS